MEAIELITKVKSGVFQIAFEVNRDNIGNGTGFIVKDGFVTNSHVIRRGTGDAIVLKLIKDIENNTFEEIRLLSETILNSIVVESPEEEYDFAYIKISEPEFENRHVFEFIDPKYICVGEQIIFLGYPFGMDQLTAHVGYISSKHKRNDIEILQIDGSVNGGNSGGPLIDLKSGKVAGIVTRAVTGLIEEQMKELIKALKTNQEVLSKAKGIIKIGSIDPVDALKASQAAMEKIAKDLYRSANVGIGYAYSSEYVSIHILNK